MERVLAILVALIFLAGSTSAMFEENMGVNDKAEASVDRPLINHIKAFANNYVPPLYDLITAIEDFFNSG